MGERALTFFDRANERGRANNQELPDVAIALLGDTDEHLLLNCGGKGHVAVEREK